MREEKKLSGEPKALKIGKNTITVIRTFGSKDLKEVFSDYVVEKASERMNTSKIDVKVS